MRIFYGVIVFFFAAFPANAQQTLNLEQCVAIALENNLQIQQMAKSRDIAEVNYLQSKFNFLPNLNAYLSFNQGIGTQVDNFTQQIAKSPLTAQPGISTSFNVFNGFSNWNTLKLREMEVIASQHSLEATKNTIRLNVSLAYFQVLFDQENFKISESKLTQLEKQVEKTERLLEAGTITLGDLLSLKAQVSTEKVNKISQQNLLERDLLSLVQYMELDPDEKLEVASLPLEMSEIRENLPQTDVVFENALNNLPEIREKKMRVLISQYNSRIAKSAFMPNITASFGSGTFFSSNAREILGYNPQTFQIEYGSTVPMFTQFRNNFGSSVSLSLNVPIFNRYTARQNYRVSQIRQESAQLDLEIQENTVLKQITQAIQDVRAAQAKYLATQEQLESLEESARYAQNKYDSGLMDFYSYLDILNQKISAEMQSTSAKYDFLLKKNLLNIYQGKPLSH